MLKLNIIKGIFWQSIGLIANFVSIPICISYLGTFDYGVWITVFSIALWLSGLDLGIGNGFRNKLAIAFSQNRPHRARIIISNGYASIGAVALILMGLAMVLIFVGSNVFKFDIIVENQLSKILYILVLVLGLDLIFKLTGVIYTADQIAFVLPAIGGINSLLILVITFLLYKTDFTLDSGKLSTYAYFVAPVPLTTSLIMTIVAFNSRYRHLFPNCNLINLGLVHSILKLGWQFFAIQLSMLLLFQLTNLMVATWSSPEEVTYVNIADKYFGLISVIGSVLLFPFWSRFTQANEKEEHRWIQKTLQKLELFFISIAAFSLIMLFIFPYAQKIWLGDLISIPFNYAILILLKYLFILSNSIYSYYLNGIGKLKVQLILYITFAGLNIPVSYGLFLLYGVEGVLIFVPCAVGGMSFIQKLYVKSIITRKLREVNI